MSARFAYRSLEDASLEGALLVVGYPTPGFVGLVGAHHLVESQKLQLAGALESDELQPTVALRDGLPVPAVRVHVGEQACGLDSRCDRLAVLVVDLLLPSELHRAFAQGVLDLARDQGVRNVVCVEALPAPPPGAEGARLVGAGATREARALLDGQGVARADGVAVSGVTAALLAEAGERGFPLAALFVQASADRQDAGAAAAAIEVIDRFLLHIPLDVAPLRERAERISKRVEQEAQRQRAYSEAYRGYG